MIPRASSLALLALVLTGCGGGSGSGGINPGLGNGNPRVSIAWPARSRAFGAPAFAQSANVVLTPVGDEASEINYAVDRPAGEGAVVRTAVAPLDLAPGLVTLTVDFRSSAGGIGDTVASASVEARLKADGTLVRPDGKPLGDVAYAAAFSELGLLQSGYLDPGDAAPLGVYGVGRNGPVALAPGSVRFTVTDGSDVLRVRSGNVVEALREGVATVVATVDGLKSAPTAIVVQGAALTPRALALTVKSLLADPKRGTVWASLPGYGPVSEGVAEIDPATGAVGAPIPVGAGPDPLALSDDGTTLFVGLDGDRTVRPVDLATRTPGVAFPVRQDVSGSLRALNIAVQPGSASTIAITTAVGDYAQNGPEIYDAGIPRPNRVIPSIGTLLTWTSPARIVGINGVTNSFEALDVAVDPNGATLVASRAEAIANFASGLILVGSRLYVSDGSVLDAVNLARVGRFDFSPFVANDGRYVAGPVVDVAANRAFFVTFDFEGTRLRAFRLDTLAPVSVRPLAGVGDLTSAYRLADIGLVRAGARRLAFHTADRVFLIDDVPGL